MKEMQFTVDVNAPKAKVWNALFDDESFRDWGNIIDEGQYMLGEIKEGNEVQFISADSGYGVTSLVENLVPNEFVLFRQLADTQDSGERERDDEWTGGSESYSLTDNNDGTTLTVNMDVPLELEEMFAERMPRALQRMKELAES